MFYSQFHLKGSHEKFIEGAEDLEVARKQKLWRIAQWKKYRIENIERMYEAEKQQANDEYEVLIYPLTN